MCGRVDEVIRAWERTGRLTREEFALVEAHLGRCRRCASAHGALLPLLRYDAGGSSGLPVGPAHFPESFTEGLMGRLAGAGTPGGTRTSRRRLAPRGGGHTIRASLILGLSVALILVAGFLGWLWGLRPRAEEVLVHFELVAPEAGSVNLVGDFNGWDPQGLAMKDVTGQGDWRITVRLKKGQLYTYSFLLNGRDWIADPGSLRQVDDGFGGKNSVLEL